MLGKVTGILTIIGVAASLVVSCVSDGGDTVVTGDGGSAGGNGQPCYPNGSCNSPYLCVTASNVCVDLDGESNITDANTTDGGPVVCPVTVTSIPNYKYPSAVYTKAGSCNANDMSVFDTPLDGNSIAGIYAGVSPACQKCVFSGESDTTWESVVVSPDLATGLVPGASFFLNVGPIFQQIPDGGGAACGKAAQDLFSCVSQACPGACSADANCTDVVGQGVGTCATEEQAAHSSCSTGINADDFGSINLKGLADGACG